MPITGDPCTGACVGLCFQELWKLIISPVSKCLEFKSTRERLKSRVRDHMKKARGLNGPNGARLLRELEEAKELEERYSNVPCWKCCCLPSYQEKLHDKVVEIDRNIPLVQLDTASNVEDLMNRDTTHHQEEMRFNSLLLRPHQKPDHLIVGLDVLFAQLRNWLLLDDSTRGVSVHVLTGLAGSGKSTLATLLCCDQKVKDKFGDNIMYIELSKSSDLMSIVQSVIQNVPAVISDDQAVRVLKSLLRTRGETSPVMLVLDNVGPSSQSLVEAFRVHMSSDYKILVTSRVNNLEFETSSLKKLEDIDAVTLFRHFAFADDNDNRTGVAYTPEEELVKQVARACHCSPKALQMIGSSLRGKPVNEWQKVKTLLSRGDSLLDFNYDLLKFHKDALDDALEDKQLKKEYFMDLALFPHHKIPVAALIDMWAERNNLDDGNNDGMIIVHDLNKWNLVNLIVKTTREVTSHVDNYYNYHFLIQHDLLKEVAIHQAKQERFELRNRLILDGKENSWPQKKNRIARTLSISIDNMLTPDWSTTVKTDKIEVLIFNLHTDKYKLPDWIKTMTNLKVLLVTNYNDFHFAELENFEILGCLRNLRRIRLQNVSVPPFCKMNNLLKLSLYNCETSQFFSSDNTISISEALPNLQELSVDYCKDLKKLPATLCDITSLMKLSITRCISFVVLPQEIEKLENLRVLRLSSCAMFWEIPASIGKLQELQLLDIWGCVSLQTLPEEIGDLLNLKELHMTCSPPESVTKLQKLTLLICDQETSLIWQHRFKHRLPDLEIKETLDDKLFIHV